MRVLTIGTLDGLHEGHRELLTWCYRLAGDGADLHVGVNATQFVHAYKGRQPSEAHHRIRAVREMFAGAVPAANITENPQRKPGDSVLPMLQAVRPKMLVVGDDWFPRGVRLRPEVDGIMEMSVPSYLHQIGVTWDQLHDLGTVLAFKPRGRNPVHTSGGA